jgi:hypothetical protein
MKTQRRSRESEKEKPAKPRLAISLGPREQSLLYCELEYSLSSALHRYMTAQLDQGRLDPNKLKRIADAWSAQGRPRVVGFRYDVETQLELVSLHSDDFRFYGRRQGNPVEVAGLLSAMRTNARAMRVRTFCQPDTVIAKQLCDSQSLFNLIGCNEAQQIALAEILQFFKVIVEREQVLKFRREAGENDKVLSYGQSDGHWGPPARLQDEANPHGRLKLVLDGYDADNEELVYST